MFKSSRLFTSTLAVLLAVILFPFSAMALTENVLETAPEISLAEDFADETGVDESENNHPGNASYSPVLSSLPERGTVQGPEELNLPRLTDAELALAREILAARESGEKPDFTDRHYALSEKVYEAGVYPLEPEEFGGNTFYVILPYFEMNREQLLSLISAFEELGIPFDPDSLNSTNCVRGTSLLFHSSTRGLTNEEQSRIEEIRRQISHGVFNPKAFTPVSSCRTVLVQKPGYSGLGYDYLNPFSFYPYRAMTDNELATFAFAQDSEWEIQPDLLERAARQYAHQLFSLPLSMNAYDETRSAYSGNHIEFRNYFRIESAAGDGLYASPDETPGEVMVEQELYREQGGFPAEASVARVLIDYPALYDGQDDSQPGCGEEELKASARRWAEKYLLIPKEDILSDWVFDQRNPDWGSIQYRLLTSEWLVCLAMNEKNARYMQCTIYDRDFTVEYDDWNLNGQGENSNGETPDTEEQTQAISAVEIDENARRTVRSLLNLPSDMTVTGASKNEDRGIQYRNDYSFSADESTAKDGSQNAVPDSMVVYQTPHFTKTPDLRVEIIFLSYPGKNDDQAQLSDVEYLAVARKWAEETLLIPQEEILTDWTYDAEGSDYGVNYTLQTKDWTVYLQMTMNGEYSWCGIYRR